MTTPDLTSLPDAALNAMVAKAMPLRMVYLLCQKCHGRVRVYGNVEAGRAVRSCDACNGVKKYGLQ